MPRWNLIAIVTDDQGDWGVGAYGKSRVVTPNIDQLARDGARFTHAFSASGVCMPARLAYLTGLYPTQVGIMTDEMRYPSRDSGLPARMVTWPKVLQRRGYRTALIGKWGLGKRPVHSPTRHGYAYFFGFPGDKNQPMNPSLVRDSSQVPIDGSLPDILVDDAIRFVEKNRAHRFALSLHFRAPNHPYGPVPEVDRNAVAGVDPDVASQELKEMRRGYYASIHSIDRNIGRLVARLESVGILDRTIIMFTSDQGYLLGHREGLVGKGQAYPIGGKKYPDITSMSVPNLFDLALRVPLIVRWPGVVEPGTTIDELVSHVDVFSSVLGMLEVAAPKPHASIGKDFSDLLRGRKVKWRDVVFAQYDSNQTGNFELLRMARTKGYKLVRSHLNAGGNRLHDLRSDPDELRNLYYPIGVESPLKARDRLQKALTEWQHLIADPALAAERAYNAARRAAWDHWK